MKYKVANTEDLLFLCEQAERYPTRNRAVDTDKLREVIDPNGFHLIEFSMPHNDVEMRTRWMVKFADDDLPHELWLDMSFEHFNALGEASVDDDG